jgi:hypothetical protein
MRKFILYFIFITLFSSCMFPSYIEHSKYGQESIFLQRPDIKIEFIETKSASGKNLTIADILEFEKKKYGNDISIINIKEQRQVTSFLFIFESWVSHYMYDVVRYKKI